MEKTEFGKKNNMYFIGPYYMSLTQFVTPLKTTLEMYEFHCIT